jgi:hypothetical protein
MNITSAARPAEQPVLESPSTDSSCPRCGAPLAEDQEWCLECGAGRTLIRRPPDWRIPLAIIGTLVLVLILAALAIALISLSSAAG